MPDKYKFRVPIDFTITIPGVTNPDKRQKLKEECEHVIDTMFRTQPNEVMFDHDIEIDGVEMHMSCRMGFMGTTYAPNRFRNKDVDLWRSIADEIWRRSMHRYDPTWSRQKKDIIKRADVPFPIERSASWIVHWIDKYKYVQFRQIELLEYWAETFKTTNKPPKPVAPSNKVKSVKKTLKNLKLTASTLTSEQA